MSRSLEAKRRRNKIDRRNRLRKLKPQSIVFGRMLGQHFPALFTPMTAVPLAIGIHDEIKAAVPAVPVDVLTRFLRFWTSRPVYLQALAKPDAERLHLDGTPQQLVDADARQHARDRLATRRRKRAMKLDAVGAATEVPA